ncbi:excalibur calcium-binding domain-containing protein [Nocardia sp. NPDC003482]|uniref:excalibur calcium-binding domain-containing protein n=1 Tax=Nocardia sp. NPDC004068 TaxID=3364303 RepID=UPI0036A768ED
MKISSPGRSALPILAAGLLAAGVVSAPLAAAGSDSSAAPSAGGSGWSTGHDGTLHRPDPAPRDDAPETRYFVDCAQVIAEGRAPLLAGQPGYDRRLDSDGDGVACTAADH